MYFVVSLCQPAVVPSLLCLVCLAPMPALWQAAQSGAPARTAHRLHLTLPSPSPLPPNPTDPTNLPRPQRRKVTSSAKKRRKAGERRLAQTPDGSYLDYVRNWAEVLRLGGASVPEASRGNPQNLFFTSHLRHHALGE